MFRRACTQKRQANKDRQACKRRQAGMQTKTGRYANEDRQACKQRQAGMQTKTGRHAEIQTDMLAGVTACNYDCEEIWTDSTTFKTG